MNPLTLLLADSRFPSRSYAHSLGLEQAVNDGLTDVPAFIAARLRLVAAADARFAVEARRAAAREDARGAGRPAGTEVAGGGGPRHEVTELEAGWCARCPSPILREAARRLGAQLLRSASAIWPVTPA